MKPGTKNSITDVEGINVGHAQDKKLMSGTTVILPEKPAVAAVDCRGGAPGTRETDVLNPANLIDEIHAIVLSGGSAMGLDAASGVVSSLKKLGRGFPVAKDVSVPIVPTAILFDLLNGGEKSCIKEHTYFEFGKTAVLDASCEFPLGTVGAGTGAKAGTLKGGVGTSSLVQKSENSIGYTVGALAVTNSFGSVTLPELPDFWAWPFEQNSEFGGRGTPKKPTNSKSNLQKNISELVLDYDFESPFKAPNQSEENNESSRNNYTSKIKIPTNTTLCVVATDASLNKAQAKRVAIMAQDGLARAIRPVHTPFDGDTVFVLSTGQIKLTKTLPTDIARIGMMASDCVSRAIARGVYAADSLGTMQSYGDWVKT